MGEVDKPAPAPEPKGSEDVEAEITVRVTENGKVQSVAAWERRAVMPVQAQGVRYAQYVPKTAYLALRAELAQAREEIAAIKRQAEDATEYVLAVDNRELRKEIEGLRIRVGEYEDMTEINKRFSEIEAELAQAREERDCILVECYEQWKSGGEIPRWMVNDGLLIRARKELSNNEKD